MASWMVLLLVAITPGSNRNPAATIKQRVDLIELNHFVDEDGREVFQQVIFYEWSRIRRRFHVRAWRLIKHESQIPTRHWSPERYQCQWHDDGLLRQVWAPQMRETWSQSDPERVNRAMLPEDQRLPLSKPIPPAGENPTDQPSPPERERDDAAVSQDGATDAQATEEQATEEQATEEQVVEAQVTER